jgi:hypothetical protein
VWRGDLGVRLSTRSGEISAILVLLTDLSALKPLSGEGEKTRDKVPSPSHGDVCAAYAGL